MIEILAFDADDTLWHSEIHFRDAQQAYERILAHYLDVADAVVHQRLLEVERRNVKRFGYGAKGMTLSMIEAAITLTEGRISGHHVQAILEIGHGVLEHPVELLPHVEETVAELAKRQVLVLITKGDLFHQEAKVARSGMGRYFRRIEIVSEKDVPTYQRLLEELNVSPDRFMMVGNSPKSDIQPVLALGGHGVLIPYPILWEMERSEPISPDTPRFAQVADIRQIPALLDRFA
ncbi:haloacid dehalogenase [Ahniella affigens]|uniref:Haloacid dehalogenase n=1 Tax=Ahniella affigens TaxID=2021234 RepID=A0A2P1PRM3_9GAMM|nr:HAD family hydrolase [Ahniella affigens]AVP97475.1 haloacid dehalogenase [Ahniella affigens]